MLTPFQVFDLTLDEMVSFSSSSIPSPPFDGLSSCGSVDGDRSSCSSSDKVSLKTDSDLSATDLYLAEQRAKARFNLDTDTD